MSEDEDVDQFLRVEQDMVLEQSLEQQQPPDGVGERVGAQAAEVPSVRTRNQGRQNVNYHEDSDSSDEEPARVRRTTNGDQNVSHQQPTFTPTPPASKRGECVSSEKAKGASNATAGLDSDADQSFLDDDGEAGGGRAAVVADLSASSDDEAEAGAQPAAAAAAAATDAAAQPEAVAVQPIAAAAAAQVVQRTVQSLKRDHQTALIDESHATAAYRNAQEAKKSADEKKKRAFDAKGAAFASPVQTAAWKAAVREAKEAGDACKTAKDAALRATAARKAAWVALVKARSDEARREAEARHAAAAGFERRRNTLISAPRQATEGLKPWTGCPSVTAVRLASGKLPALDGHEETAVDGLTVSFAPLLGGSTVLVAQTGGMKTVRALGFLQQPVDPELEARVEWPSDTPSWTLPDGSSGRINADLPFVFVTARINLAHKLDADLAERSIEVHNYKNKPEDVTMEAWLNHPRVIISIEQLEKLETRLSMYKDGTVVFDEFVTGASSLVNGVTVHRPMVTLRTLSKMVDASSYFIAMDADFDANGKGKALLKGVAAKKPVLHVQTTLPSLKTTVVYGYAGIPEHEVAFEERLELSCLTSAEARRNGTAPEGNRTYIGEDWPSDVSNRCEQLRGWRVPVKGLHGKMGGAVRKNALKDLDAYVEDADAFVVSSVAGIGTDQDCKYRAGFVRLRSGDRAPGPRSGAQKIARMNRNGDNPLDSVTAPDGTVYGGGVVYVLLPGPPPSPDADGNPDRLDPRDRAERKLKAMRSQVDERRSAVTSTHLDAERRFDHHNATYLQRGGGEYTTLPGDTPRPTTPSDDAATLAELEALQNVEDDDKRPCSYAVSFFEYMALPRFSGLAPIQSLSDTERAELKRLRGGQKGDAHVLTEDEAVGEMTPREIYSFVKERVEADNHSEQGSPFWTDCYGMCVSGKARYEGSNMDEAFMAVWDALHRYQIFPEEDAFMDLYNDGNDSCVLHRGMMRFLSMEELLQSEMQGLKLQVLSDPTAGELRPLYKLSLLKECARLLQLDLADLLEPRVYTPSAHAWVAVHNRLIDGTASMEDRAMAGRVRAVAIKLGCKGIRHGERVKKPTSLLATVHGVLTQRCAMRPPDFKKNTARSPVRSWAVEELAPGCAERGLHWHDGVKQKVPLGEYASRDAAWRAHMEEEERRRRARQASAATDAMLDQFGDDEGMEEGIVTDALMPAAPHIAPHDPNVLYVHYEDAALQECLRAYGADEPQRTAAAYALSDLIAKRAAMPGVGDADAELVKMRAWKKALNRLATRHRIAAELGASLPAAATEGPLEGARVACEGYAYFADGEGRRYAKGERWLDEDGEWRSATAQGMPSDLRTKLLGWKYRDKDGRKSDLAIYVIVASRLGLPRSSVNVLIDEYLRTDEACKAWHDGVAQHHGIRPEAVKRWPNILGNGGSYATCLARAGLPPDSPHDARVERMQAQLKKLRPAIVTASRTKPNALWPGSEQFVDRHDARLQRERPHLQPRERFNKVYSYLVETAEDKILTIHAQAQRAVRRAAIGPLDFDALPPEVRDTGLLAFDGLATEAPGGDPEAGDRAAETALVGAGWHAQSWGIEYKIVEKPMFGEQHVDPDELESAKGARRALREAAAAYPEEVQRAVDNPSTYQRRARPAAGGNASVIPVSEGRALLTVEVRKGEQKYGLLGGKAEPGDETLAKTAARGAFEESGRTLSDAARNAISRLEPAAFRECRAASMHVAVAPVGPEDAAAPDRFIEANANRAGSSTRHVGIEWVDLADLLDHRWRKDKVHYHQALMVAAVRETLREHVVSGAAVSGGKRARDESPGPRPDAAAMADV